MSNSATSVTRRAFVATAVGAVAAQGQRPAQSGLGLSPDCFVIARQPRTPVEYMQYAYERGAGGVQAMLPPNVDAEYLKKTRQTAEKLNMYWEVVTMLPRDEQSVPQFEATIKNAREAGAACMRSVCLSGRRYETFNTMEEWKKFVADAHARLERAAKVVERLKFPLGIENHKDWTIEEMVPLMKKFDSEYVGTCIDFGNNISLLDDPIELVEELGRFVINTHIKDMAVQEYEDGFLLAEVALGQGYFDLKRMVSILQKYRPNVKFSLDMLTRDALKVPCLTDKYWVTYTQRHGRYLARMLRTVKQNPPKKPIAVVTQMDREARLALEQANVVDSCAYARDVLGLKPAA